MKNLVEANALDISATEIEDILQFDLGTSLALEMAHVLILRHREKYLSFWLLEAALMFLGTLFLVPINLLIWQKWLSDSNQLQSFIIVISCSTILSFAILLCFNGYLWQKAKKLKTIAIILKKIAGYNCLIENLQLMTAFNSLSAISPPNSDRSSLEIATALQITKDSLLKSIEIEKFILRDRRLQLKERYQLFNNLEADLIEYMSFSNRQNTTENSQLLAEAIQIGLSVHKELRKNITLSS